MFLQDIRNYWSEEEKTLLLEIGGIYRRHYSECRERDWLKELTEDISRTESGEQK